MNVEEVGRFYWLVMGVDGRNEQLDDRQLQLWAYILRDVPADAGNEIFDDLCRRHLYTALQPGDVYEAWERVRVARAEERRAAAPDCPIHEGQKLPHCGACRSEVLTGDRPPGQVGVALSPPHERRARPVEAATARVGQMPN